ncbi:hypothetical protein [Priestia megaterium]|uniref:hypothetical protein n=1 Tax=Priestia megaterium TaxID=1404 RepID=UPI003CC53E92
MKTIQTNIGTYEAMKIISATSNYVGVYEYTHQDGELIEGYEYKEINKDHKNEFVPVVKVECADGYFYSTNYDDDVKIRL